jgi:hypothetical protein
MTLNNLFGKKLNVINIGLESFKKTLDERGINSIQIDWQPPVAVDGKAMNLVNGNRQKIDEANGKAMTRILAGKPVLVGLAKAIDVIPGMNKDLILHAGPPINWERMCGPMRGAVIGALIYEGRAANPEEAEKLASSGKIQYSPCHEHNAVGPMAGIISPSMPVFIIKNEEFGNTAYTTMNEGLGKVLRYGAFSDEVVTRLKWMEAVLYPTLAKAINKIDKIDLKNILAPHIVRTADSPENAALVLEFIHGNDHFFLNLSMAACKAVLDPARNIANSSIVVVMARNGTDFGVQLAGTGNQWFIGPAPVPDALFFVGFTKEDANPDIGDSAITETGGLGGFAIAAAPAIVQFVGGSARDAVNYTMQMYEITAAENGVYQIPYLNFRGTPTGIDVVKVIEKNILPFIDTGVAHKKAGVGQVGAGVLSAPLEPFVKAYEGLANEIE